MSNRKNLRNKINLAAKVTAGQTTKPIFSVAEKSISRTRQDIKSWNDALNLARKNEDRKWYPLQLLYDEIFMDAHRWRHPLALPTLMAR